MAADRHWDLVQELFEQALELPPAERARFLADRSPSGEVSREVEELLAHDTGASQVFHAAVAGIAGEVVATREPVVAGRVFGPWRVTGTIGHGGMGAVYEVERADGAYRQKAALKMIRADHSHADGLRRFLEERDILARLEHPNIARLLDGGSTPEGQPYLVMELISGCTITEYCSTHKLSIAQRIRLFLDVCSAVQLAHSRLVVHRDLKPSNILVTGDRVVKLLDFGIAKMLDPASVSQTLTGQMLLTPEYASPEQVDGSEITTATDVYSLGVVLYELLTTSKAHALTSSTPAEIVRVVMTKEPPLASAAAPPADRRRLRGDLDNILRLSMRKEASRRYASVQTFQEDLERYLDGRPVRARPDTLSYRTAKFVRRNRLAVAAALVVGLSLAGAAWVSRVQARRAQARFDEVRTLANKFLFDFHDSIRDLPGSTAARQMVVQTARHYLDRLASESSGDPKLQLETAAAYERLGDVLGDPYGPSLGRAKEARESYEKSFRLREIVAREQPSDPESQRALTASYLKRADGEMVAGRQSEGLALAEEAARRAAQGKDARQEYGALQRIGEYMNRMSRPEEAIAYYQRAIAAIDKDPRAFGDKLDASRIATLGRIARAQKLASLHTEAETTLSGAIATANQILSGRPDDMYWLRQSYVLDNEMADIYTSPFMVRDADWREARRWYELASTRVKRMRELDPKSFTAMQDEVINRSQIAEATSRIGDPHGVDMLEDTARFAESVVAQNPNQVDARRTRMTVYEAAGYMAGEFGQWQRSARTLDRAVQLMDELIAADPKRIPVREVVLILALHGRTALQTGQHAKARADLERCRSQASGINLKTARIIDLRDTAFCFHYSGDEAAARGDRPGAAAFYREAVDRWQRAIDRPTPGTYLRQKRDWSAAAIQAASGK